MHSVPNLGTTKSTGFLALLSFLAFTIKATCSVVQVATAQKAMVLGQVNTNTVLCRLGIPITSSASCLTTYVTLLTVPSLSLVISTKS